MRLQKYIAICGVASRRRSEVLIESGRVKVNGKTVTEMGFKIDPNKDTVIVDGRKIDDDEKAIYLLLNKPRGYITTASDQFNRKKVTDLIDLPYRIFPVGRLDYDTSGLLILTNDGDLTYKLTHPKFKVEKVYVSKIKGVPTQAKIQAFKSGLQIEDYITAPANFKILSTDSNFSTVEITIREGKNRQIRKMCDAIGHPVIELERVAMGKIQLGNLKLGSWRHLKEEEINYLKKL
ncbi:pseudouridine synthase [Alkaliphilus peptidifermentans]|uniref:Pseudouridine synthase n=1 Tax=Alkaliphilus peptidifermentans DSM 18978 TaxID=1120976 RepID=A0A1G5L668_9FIRM|nr:pseudouridine synthase [Alkaliphilus peptidifermentans]SCZ08382.1 ribosomal large subunit pseudouridine synthase B [Alkaliphilus peptidifermentans DSM 18978]